MPGCWNIVNVKAVTSGGNAVTRGGKMAVWSRVGPARMSLTPLEGSASMRTWNSRAVADFVVTVDLDQLACEFGAGHQSDSRERNDPVRVLRGTACRRQGGV